ncbi:hypothetical protein Anas_06288 [Armadillidium nasatum]|uniref:PIF1/LRR1 pleckstrin homology domain-containing protein n=1 Tax=Armadillidium nasatum TaxID=96803 RepID=A0A5N5SU50_9CRUS|nr:hypothetical protein Anas_06288 [Armadillidium nasatum]
MSESDLRISSPVICCSLTVETLFPQGTIKKSTCYKSSKISLGRNEFRDIILQMEAPKLRLDFIIKKFNLHKKFLREGKATLQLKDQLTNLMIANAPPNALLTFLKVLNDKTEKHIQNNENVPARARMLSNLPKAFDEISPMTVKK